MIGDVYRFSFLFRALMNVFETIIFGFLVAFVGVYHLRLYLTIKGDPGKSAVKMTNLEMINLE